MNQLAFQTMSAPRLERRQDGQLWVTLDGRACPVQIARCFPWSARNRFISLRDDDRDEVLLVEDPATLDGPSRAALEEALIEADFVLDVLRINAIDEEIEIRCWDVETGQGQRSFQTKRDDWPRIVPGGGVLIRDVAGDLYFIRRPQALDAHSRALLEVFVD
ncbi:MAG: DUF1854 domain-containing protein [Gammaproteobacteria bacterium]|nr:DUF1854 domain-containing protein [Gammaproteobacteria bacterium]